MEFQDTALVVENDFVLNVEEAKEIQIPALITQSNQKFLKDDVSCTVVSV